MKHQHTESSSDDDDDDVGGAGRLSPRSGGGSRHTFPGARKPGSRSRSKSPLRGKQHIAPPQSPDGQ